MIQDLTFGAFVRQRRRELDLTQEELARRVGCAAITLRKIEADDLRASVQIAERLAMALAIPLDERSSFVRQARAVRPEAAEPPQVTPAPTIEEIGREDLTGRAIRGYALSERIGMGGMGSVYRAVQPNVDREVAVKIILPAFANHPDFIRRFEAEAQLVARLEHPHIVPLYDYWREPGVAYLVMRLLRGGNVQNLLGQGPLPLDITTHMLEQVCSALNAAHRIGVIHRDLKPANVLLDEDNNAYLADFGIAKNLGDPDFENQTQVDAIIGSPQYMSPEQIRSLSVRPQTDVYCLGVMLYEMLTGALPFTGPTPFDLIQQHVNAPMPPLSARRAGLPAALDAVITRATAKDPDDRYADALSMFQEFRQAVGRLAGEQPAIIAYEEEDTDAEIANPFKGLRAFSEADTENFFGRETLVQQLLARLGEGGDLSRFLAVIGPSGSGKSSVVRAGLIPALRRGGLPGSENWFIVDMLPGKHPFEELEASLLRVAVNPPESLLTQLKEGNRGLLRAVNRILPSDDAVELVLMIDQFEEVFTLIEDEAERALFLESLATAVLDERSRFRVVITLRADFTDKPLRYVDFGELMNRRFEFVLPLTPDELERAIAGPAQRVGLKLEKGLVSTIIRDTGNQPGALPLLQYALSELFDKREGRTLTNKVYKEIGGALGALGRSAQVIYVLLNQQEQAVVRQLFLRLVTLGEGTEDTRRRVLREELESLGSDKSQLSTVLDAFGRARLLSFDHDPITRGATIEVAHEALLREWTRLREWLNESRADVRIQRQLAHAVQEWNQASRDASFLMSGSRLEQFDSWAENTTVALTQDERAFLDASIAERQKLVEKEKRAAIRLRKLNRVISVTGAIALVLAIAAGMFGLSSSRNAQQALNAQATSQAEAQSRATAEAIAVNERNIAQQQSLVASVRELAGAATINLDIDPERSLLLALQAAKLTTDAGQPPLKEVEVVLHQAVQTSRVLMTLHGHQGEVTGVATSLDGTKIASISDDNTIKIWDAKNGQALLSIPLDTLAPNKVRKFSFSPDSTLIVASAGNSVKLWNAVTGKEIQTFTGHTGEVYSAAFSPDGTRIVSCGEDDTARVWDAVTGKEYLTLNHESNVFDAAFSPDGSLIATAVEGGQIAGGTARIWDANTGQELLNLPHNNDAVYTIAFSPDGKILLTGSGDTTWRLFDTTTGSLLRMGYAHASLIEDVAFDPTGVRFATGSEDGTAKIWDTATGRELVVLTGHTSGVLGVAFTSDGNRLVTVSRDYTVRIWNVSPTAGGEWLVLTGHTDRVMKAIYSPDGKLIATASVDNTVKIWDAITGQEIRTMGGFTDGIWDLSFSPDGKRIVATGGAGDGFSKVWDVATGKELLTIPTTGERMIFSPDGLKLATANPKLDADHNALELTKLLILDAASGKELITIDTGIKDFFQSIAFSRDGKQVAISGEQGSIAIWDSETGKELQLIESKNRANKITFSPDGKWVVSSSNDSAIHIWDIATGKELYTLTGHTGPTFAVTFSPDGKLLATSSVDRTIKIWNVTDGFTSLPLTLYGHTRAVYTVDFSLDGSRIVTASRDGTARVYAIAIDDLVKLAQSRLTRGLTVQECQQYLHVDACPSQ